MLYSILFLSLLLSISLFTSSYNCFAFPYTNPWLSLFQSSICPDFPLHGCLSLPFFLAGSSILRHIFHSSFASEELSAKVSSLPQKKVATGMHTKAKTLVGKGESRRSSTQPLPCAASIQESAAYKFLLHFPPATSMWGKGSKRSPMGLPDCKHSKKKIHSFLAEEQQMFMPPIEPLERWDSQVHRRKLFIIFLSIFESLSLP